MTTDDVTTVVTQRRDVTTARQLKAVEVVSMPWWQIVGVRALRVYLQGLVGFLTANTSGATEAITGMPMGDFGHQLVMAMSLAVAPAVLSLLMNVTELLARLDQTNPRMRG